MKKLLVLRCEDLKAGKKTARTVKKQYEKLWGPGTCEVVVLPINSCLEQVGWDTSSNSLDLSSIGLPPKE